MSTIANAARLHRTTDKVLRRFARETFDAALAAGVVLSEQRDEYGDRSFLPTTARYAFDSYEVTINGMSITGWLTFCGELDYVHVFITFDMMADVPAWIKQQQAAICANAVVRRQRHDAQIAEDARHAEAVEAEHYARLKAKYEP